MKHICIRVILLGALFFNTVTVWGQQDTIRQLKVGDKVPDIWLNEMINYKSASAKISDFRGKLLILDFWSVWCPSCISGFPKIVELQKEFRKQIQILPIGFDAPIEGSIKKFISSKSGTLYPKQLITSVQHVNDKTLSKLFPFSGLPHIVWIDSNGIVIAITGSQSLTKEKIRSTLDGKSIAFGSKKLLHSYNPNEKLLLSNREGSIKRAKIYGSAVSGYIDTLVNMYPFGKQMDTSVVRLFGINKTPFNYYQEAYAPLFKELMLEGGSKRISVEITNKPFYNRPDFLHHIANMDDYKIQNFFRENFFCYELILPKKYNMEEAYECMRTDLDKFFEIKSSIQKRKVKCLLLVNLKKPHKELYKSKNNTDFINFSIDSTGNQYFKNLQIELFVNKLNARLLDNNVIINKTDYSGNVDVVIPKDCSTLSQIRSFLNQIGLDLAPQEIELDMLVLEDRLI